MESKSSSLKSTLSTLRWLVRKGVPSFKGTIPLDPSSSRLYFTDKDEKPRFIDFSNASAADLEALSDTCDVATFGLSGQSVHDETYRKAGKLDTSKFSAQFASVSADILEEIRERLVPEDQFGDRPSLHGELYKLNVYGPGSFFKPHVDTPRSESMIASLVIVLPTIHQGGALVLRHKGKEETFDTSRASFDPGLPREIHWTTFYSDIEHEVLPVESGYRVTLTYNIYTIPKPPISDLSPNRVFGTTNTTYLSALQNLFCRQKHFLPGGGLVGFGLSHKYAFKTGNENVRRETPPVSSIVCRLKGRDRELFALLSLMGFKPSLKVVYLLCSPESRWDAEDWDEILPRDLRKKLGVKDVVLSDRFVSAPECTESQRDTFPRHVMDCKEWCGAERSILFERLPEPNAGEEKERFKGVFCITPLQHFNKFFISFATYGNEPTTDWQYGDIALIVDLPRFNERRAMRIRTVT